MSTPPESPAEADPRPQPSRPGPPGNRKWWGAALSPFRVFTPGQLYVLVSALLVLGSARVFYGALRTQTEQVMLWFAPDTFPDFITGERAAPWSAPLDDVFIHFDFARAAARGFPFEWSEGNGYSSGGTSLLYPFLLATGYLLGYRGLTLMHFAGVVACIAVLLTLLLSRRLFHRLDPRMALFLPPLFLSVGGLCWTLWSGMEVAVFLAVWAGCVALWLPLVSAEARQAEGAAFSAARQSFLLGALCLLLVATRPEAAPLVGLFAVTASWPLLRERQYSAALRRLLVTAAPGGLLVVSHLVANKLLTGDSTAAGGLAKLELHHPYMSGEEVRHAWLHFFRYQFERMSLHHFSALPGVGFLLWPLSLLGLLFRKTRREVAFLWVSILLWASLVALNGQVRWQNERYAMPWVAFLLCAVALGVGGATEALLSAKSRRGPRLGLFALLLSLFVYFAGQAPRFSEQVWFFARAGRNILEQHIRTGDYLARVASPRPHRVMVSDAGAIPFIADLPAFDLIGLGGYRGLPIARASRQGVGAAVELLSHLPDSEKPDLLALYPSWWGDFVHWFGRPRRTFGVRGNVICGGMDMVIYEPDWSPLAHSEEPFSLTPGERLTDSVDVADLLSEKAHRAGVDMRGRGYVDMKMLADPREPRRDLWDAGRLLTPDVHYDFRAATPEKGGALLVRVAPLRELTLTLKAEGEAEQTVLLNPGDHWQEVRLPLAPGARERALRLGVLGGDVVVHHLFIVE